MVIGRWAALLIALIAADWHAAQLGANAHSGWTSAQTIMVRDTGALRQAWNTLYPNAAFRPAMPLVDFRKYQVMVYATGTKPTGGFRLALSSSSLMSTDTASVLVTLFTPAAGCGVSQELTSPAVAIALPIPPVEARLLHAARPDTVRCN